MKDFGVDGIVTAPLPATYEFSLERTLRWAYLGSMPTISSTVILSWQTVGEVKPFF
jgi:hypothetical protein